MKKEAYPDKMVEEYDLAMEAYPEHFKLRIKVAEILKNCFKDSKEVTILEIGCGSGETTEYILKQLPNIKVIALDKDQRMINRLKERSKKYVDEGRLIPVCQDIFTYIPNSMKLDGVTSSWTIHNFTKSQRSVLLKEIYRVLKPNGIFVNMDKYVLDDPEEEQKSFEERVKKSKLIPKKDLYDASVKHEDEDRHPDIIMKEKESISEMEKIGFKDIHSHMRIEREVVISCLK